MFDATDLEIARREHAAEMGESSPSERAWLTWSGRVEACLTAMGWDEKFEGGARAGESRGLDGAEDEDGYSIDFAFEAFERGESVDAYLDAVKTKRMRLGRFTIPQFEQIGRDINDRPIIIRTN
jgi:hypothetical protein